LNFKVLAYEFQVLGIYIYTYISYKIFPKIRYLQKNGSDKNCQGEWGSFMCINNLDLKVEVQGFEFIGFRFMDFGFMDFGLLGLRVSGLWISGS